MKKSAYLWVITFMMIQLVISSCKKDKKEDSSPSSSTTTASEESISKKWIVDDAKSSRTQSTMYKWFEFNKDKRYIVADTGYHYGTYTISADKKTITLENFGTITITSISSNSFSFKLTVGSSATSVTIVSNVGTTVATSSKTDLLCRAWKVLKITFDTTVFYSYPDTMITKYEVVFTKYGTYFIHQAYASSAFPPYSEARVWKWKDAAETKFCFGIFDATCNSNGSNEATIEQISSTYLKITEENPFYGHIVNELVPL